MKRRHILAVLAGLFGGPSLAATADEALHPPPDADARLNALLQQPKFQPSPDGLYTWVYGEAGRLEAEATVNRAIRDILDRLPKGLHRRWVLRRFKVALDQLALSDTDDRERVAEYFQEIMGYIGLESSDGLLNKYVYGFDIGALPTK